jgi:hypothetical protein
MPSTPSNTGASPAPASSVTGVVEQIAAALSAGAFDPQHAGELFLRADAEKAIRVALGPAARVAVAGRDEGQLRASSFMGTRFAPDLVVESGGQQVAVTLTLLRGDASPVAQTLAGALVLSSRFPAVVAFILDRRLAKRNPFDDPTDAPAQRELSDAERALIRQLWERHQVRVEVRRQDPFGW